MQTTLRQLHRKLAQVARRRRWSRRVAGGCAAAVAVLWVLAGTFLLDVVFELDVIQRLIVLTLAAAALGWSFVRFVKPWFGVHESESDLALMMENRYQIDNDLIAAIQFERADNSRWGSTRLQRTVIDSASLRSGQLDVHHTLDVRPTWNRSALLAISLLAAAATCLVFPQHVTTFLQRLALTGAHYPASTVLEAVIVNGDLVMTTADESTPRETRSAENQPVWFVVRASDQVPAAGEIVVRGDQDRSRARISLKQISDQQRAAAFEAVIAALRRSADQADHPRQLAPEQLALVQAEVPQLRGALVDHRLPSESDTEASQLRDACQRAQTTSPTGVIFLGRIPEMVESLQYQVYLGDAWTNRSRIRMIPLPVTEPQFEVVPPAYAAGVEATASYVGASSFTVLAASRVQLRVRSVNSRPLDSVSLRILGQRDFAQHELVPLSESRTVWGLPADSNVWQSVTEQQQYELLVKDAEGLRPREPIIGQIRVRPDQAPSAQLNTIHQVVLPAARPTLAVTVDDDYVIAHLRLRIVIERFNSVDETAQSAEPELFHVDVAADRWPLKSESLPFTTTFSLELSQWNLSQGDQLKLTLEAADGRGASPGAVTPSEPLYLEVSDQEGVLAAIAEADEEAERRLDEMIQQQLDAGEGG